MFDKLESVVARYFEIESRLADPEIAAKPQEFRRLSQEHSSLQDIVSEYQHYKKIQAEVRSNRELLEEKDTEFHSMAHDELKRLEPELERSGRALQVLLLPKDP